jgi:hypothetical protein
MALEHARKGPPSPSRQVRYGCVSDLERTQRCCGNSGRAPGAGPRGGTKSSSGSHTRGAAPRTGERGRTAGTRDTGSSFVDDSSSSSASQPSGDVSCTLPHCSSESHVLPVSDVGGVGPGGPKNIPPSAGRGLMRPDIESSQAMRPVVACIASASRASFRIAAWT